MTLVGHGIFLAPSFVLAGNIDSGRLVRLLPDFPPVEFTINDLSAQA